MLFLLVYGACINECSNCPLNRLIANQTGYSLLSSNKKLLYSIIFGWTFHFISFLFSSLCHLIVTHTCFSVYNANLLLFCYTLLLSSITEMSTALLLRQRFYGQRMKVKLSAAGYSYAVCVLFRMKFRRPVALFFAFMLATNSRLYVSA